MSKIQTIMPNQFGDQKIGNAGRNVNREVIPPMTRKSKNLSFGGEPIPKAFVNEVTGRVEKKIIEQSGWLGRLSRKLGINDSEIQTQSLNAIFTATLAPIFIALNPFSKQDKKTKEYTAARQPISALIAISGGIAMTKGVDAFTAKMASEGYIKSYDLRAKADRKDYLSYDYKKAYNKAADKQKFLDDYAPDYIDPENKFKGYKISKEYRKESLEVFAKKTDAVREKLFISLYHENPDKIKIDETTKEISLLKPDGTSEIIGENIPNLKTKKQLTEFLDENNLHNLSIEDFIKAQYPKGTKVENEKAIDFLDRVGITGDATSVGGQKFTAEDLAKVTKTANADGMTTGQMLEHFGYKGQGFNDFMKTKASKALTTLSGKFNIDGLKGYKKDATFIDITTNLFKNKLGRMSKDFGNFKKYFGIGTNLITTAITCTILNWIYPRAVALLFPSLLKSDSVSSQAQKGGNK